MIPRRFVSVLLLVLAAFVAFAAPSFPELSDRVVDQANLLSPATRQQLMEMLAAHERKTSNQVVVVTLDSLQGYAIEDYGYQLGRYWGIGQAGRDNGALLIIAPKERKVRIEVGYGLEGTLTDARSSDIIQNIILPQFRQNDFNGGTLAGAQAILQVIEGTYSPLEKSTAGKPKANASSFMGLFIVLLIVGEIIRRLFHNTIVSAGLLGGIAFLIGWLIIGSLLLGIVMAVLVTIFHLFTGSGGMGGGSFGGPYYGGYRRGGYGGGSFGGGGFSGGGGSFGGGGASGGW